jgi:mono/diheme cytochrome c family protein
VVLVAGPQAAALAQGPEPDADAGREIAAKLCANCQVTEAAPGTTDRRHIPAFQSIAERPTTTPERLASAIILPHPEMPGIPLTRQEIRSLIAYIMSLKK